MSGTATYVTKLGDGAALELEQSPGVFRPTYTSELFIKAVRERLREAARVLDLGCGSGVVGIALARMGLVAPPLHASDLSGEAVALARRNAERHGVAMDARVGSLFSPWAGRRFDCIVDDVSGIAEEVARLSPWFGESIPCASGADGSELTCAVLRDAAEHMTPDGMLLIPVISLSATGRILEDAHARFADVEKVTEERWPLPAELTAHLDRLRRLCADGRIAFEEKFGKVIGSTAVYVCRAARA